jgi:hypothetical protein
MNECSQTTTQHSGCVPLGTWAIYPKAIMGMEQNAVSVDRRVPPPVDMTAEYGFHYQVVGGRGGADANT